MKVLQLSDVIEEGRLQGVCVESAIDRFPLTVESLVENGHLNLAPGARLYLKERVQEVQEDLSFFGGNYDVETYRGD